MFKALIDKNVLDLLFSRYFQEVGMLQIGTILDIQELEIEDTEVLISADLEEIKMNS